MQNPFSMSNLLQMIMQSAKQTPSDNFVSGPIHKTPGTFTQGPMQLQMPGAAQQQQAPLVNNFHAPTPMPRNAMFPGSPLGIQSDETLQHPGSVIPMPEKREYLPHYNKTAGYSMPLPNLTSVAGKY